MSGVLTDFIELLVSGISALASGIGQGVNGFVADLFLTMDGETVTGLSVFGGVVAIFGKHSAEVKSRNKARRLELLT